MDWSSPFFQTFSMPTDTVTPEFDAYNISSSNTSYNGDIDDIGYYFNSTIVDNLTSMYDVSTPSYPYSTYNWSSRSAAAANTTSAMPLSSASAYRTCVMFRRIINTYVMGLICLFGIVGNLISILVLQKDKKNKVAIFLLQSLAAADIMLLSMSFFILSIYHGLLLDIDYLKGRSMIPFVLSYVNPFGAMAQCCVVWCTVLLAINRYIAICKPFAARKWLTMKWARIQVAVVVILAALLNSPSLFMYYPHRLQLIDKKTNTTRTFEYVVRQTRLSRVGYFRLAYFYVFYNTIVVILPFMLLVCLNIPIIKNLQRSKRAMMQNSLVYSGRQENNITVVMVIIILELVLCHVPDRVLSIYKDIVPTTSSGCPNAVFYISNIFNILVLINSSTDFIVYYMFRKRFRNYLKRRLCCKRIQYFGDSRYSQTGDVDVDELSLQRRQSNSLHARLERRST